jgi:hypothetical protein
MLKQFNVVLIATAVALCPMASMAKSLSGDKNYPTPILSSTRIEKMFTNTKQGFATRWKSFAKKRNFKPFKPKFADEEILADFAVIRDTRNSLYYANPDQHPLRANADFERSQELLTYGFYKAPHLLAFDYNRTDISYNSSNVTLNGHRFLALEGPQKPEHVPNFLRLLVNVDVKHVVRLTNDIEKGVFKSENYWRDTVTTDANGNSVLSYMIPREESKMPYSFSYYSIDDWGDNTAASTETLLQIVQNVRKNYQPGDIVAVHCSAGVGRTGTFIAAFLMLDDIDQQIAKGIAKQKVKLSLEKLVYKLSLQRAYLVGEAAQYLALHKLAKLYLEEV